MLTRLVKLGTQLFPWAVLACLLLLVAGCSHLRLPAIDPTGRQLFLPRPNFTTLNSHIDPVTGQKQHPLLDHFRKKHDHSLGSLFHKGDAKPAFASPADPPVCPPSTLAALGPTPQPEAVAPRILQPGSCQDPLTATTTTNRVCPGPLGSDPAATVSLSPLRQMAPVGSEVVLLGGVIEDGYYREREPLEWAISQGSVGHFVEPGMTVVGRLGLRGRLSEFFAEPAPELLSNTYAAGCTTKKPQVLTRGTVQTNDDVMVEQGQSWIGVTSPVEGDTYVTLMAPDLDGWKQRTRTAVIHWVDGQWTFPQSVVRQDNQPHLLTTTVTRRITPTPLQGWLVRYQILDPTATFADGSTLREVPTDGSGQASVEIQPTSPTGGSARVQVQVIRQTGETATDRVVVGEGTTTVAWSTSQLTIDLTGPADGEVQQELTYQVDVANPGTVAAADVVTRILTPGGFELVGSNPPLEALGNRLDWRIGTLGPNERRTLEMTYRVRRSGTARMCASIQSASSSPIEDCLTTQIVGETLFFEMIGPNEDLPLPVGQQIEYRVVVRNDGDQRLDNVIMRDRFDPGLENANGVGSIENPIGPLGPGEKREIVLRFRIVQPGRHCHTLEATAAGAQPARRTACVTAEEATPAEPPAAEPVDLQVRKTGPKQMIEGDRADFFVLIENTGNRPITNFQVIDTYDASMRPLEANPTESRLEADRVVWYVGQLQPGERRTFTVNVEALYDTTAAVSRVLVQGADGWRETQELELSIAPDPNTLDRNGRSSTGPPPGATPLNPRDDRIDDRLDDQGSLRNRRDSNGTPANPVDSGNGGDLEVTIDDRGERWNLGDPIEYWVAVTNRRDVPENDVVLSIELPREVKLKSYTGEMSAESHSDDWLTMRMPAIRTLRAGETVEFRFLVTVTQPGQLVARAKVRSARHPQEIVREDVSLGVAPR